ncbi:MAG: glycosyltransferase [Rhodothermales bacterium]
MLLGWTLLMVVVALGYALPITAFGIGLRRVIRTPRPVASTTPTVSVLIPARDEVASIGACVRSILDGDYPHEALEVLVIDDQSTDGTADIVREVAASYPTARVDVLRVPAGPSDLPRKKAALELGVAHATGEIILTTDADCNAPPGWVRRMASMFTPEVGFVAGPVRYAPDGSAFERMQALEFLGLVGIGLGALGLKRPTISNAANVAYRRQAFLDLGGYRDLHHIGPGDDHLLMHKFAYESEWQVRACPFPEATVVTAPAPDLPTFIHQRRRWASVTIHYTQVGLIVVCVLFYLFFLSLILGLVALPFIPALGPGLLAGWGLKLAAEWSLLSVACKHFGQRRLLWYFLPAQLPHVPYILLVTALGILRGYTWKSRCVGQ